MIGRHTRKWPIVHTAAPRKSPPPLRPPGGGFGGERAASITSRAFTSLKAAPVRVGAVSAPIPFSPPLEEAIVSGPAQITEAARRVMTA